MRWKSGFTLIELLVVTALLGIAASIVLASVNIVRKQGFDASIKANLVGIRTPAELYYYEQNPNHYGTEVAAFSNCSGPNSFFMAFRIQESLTEVDDRNGPHSVACFSSDEVSTPGGNARSWAVSSVLRSDATKEWCVDSSGVSKETTSGAFIDPVSLVARCP